MAHIVLTNAKLWMAQYDFSGDFNAAALAYGAELQDDTTFGQGTRVRKGGLKTVSIDHEGFWNGGVGSIDEFLFNNLALADIPMSLAAEGGVEGDIGYAFRAVIGQYAPGAEIGEMLAFSVAGEASQGPLVRGMVMLNRTATASGNSGTARQLGQVSATQRVYGALHVLAASGGSPTLDVIVKSDNAQGFASPANQITFAQKTAAGSEWASTPGAITDDWWRVDFTIGGTTPSFTFVCLVGIV